MPGELMLSKKTIIQKTMQMSGFTLLSRTLGIMREVLMVKYLGVSIVSDAFITAFKIPNSLRKIFAEGALSAIFVPTIVQTMELKGRDTVGSLMTFGFLVFEGAVLLLCALVMWQAKWVIYFIAPGFSPEQVAEAIPLLQIVMPFIFFVSSSALLAGALQAVGHFFITAFAPVLLNIVFISAILLCNYFIWPVKALCWFILVGGLIQFLAHLIVYFKFNFNFNRLSRDDIHTFMPVVIKFIPCLLSMSVMEVGLFIDQYFTSYLAPGATSLLYYANRFMGIPLGVFAVALSTILLPHFSRVALEAPKRLKLYLLESTKLVFWFMVPIAILMYFFSEKIFLTIFLSSKFNLLQVEQAAQVLRAFLWGLFFFAINKILLNIYYAFNSVWMPAGITIVAVIFNALMNMILVSWFGLPGLAFATSLSEIVRFVLFIVILMLFKHTYFDVKRFVIFVWRYGIQLCVIGIPFMGLYFALTWGIRLLSTQLAYFLLNGLGLWIWVAPLSLTFFGALWLSRNYFKVHLYFLEQ